MTKSGTRLFLGVLLLSLTTQHVSAQGTGSTLANDQRQTIAQIPSPLSLDVNPLFDIPLADSSQYFKLGGGADIGLSYQLPQSALFLLAGLEYSFIPDQASDSLSFAAARLGIGIRVPLGAGIGLLVSASGGYYFATFNDLTANATSPYAAAGLMLQFALNSTFRLGVGAQYTYFAGLYQGVSAMLGTSVSLGNLGGSVDIPTVRLRPAFPVFYKYYDDHPIGTLEVRSNLKVPATDVRVRVFVREFMDEPKTVNLRSTLAPGESEKVDLYALFADRMLGVTEGTKVAAQITVSYRVEGQIYEDRRIETLSVLGRNAMTWDDSRKVAAFVTAKEPQVLIFARSVTGLVRARENRSINVNLQAAIALHESLDLYGMNYTPNPVTPYAEAAMQKDVIDFLQFPRETLQYKAGDCSDLSILYGALLQAAGIDAAFVTVPGHIFIAVNTGIPVRQAAKELIPENQFIPYQGSVWIPVEVTLRHQGFMLAWQLGAKEWNENIQTRQAEFFPIPEAWESYPPVGLPGTETTFNPPQSDKVLAAYSREVQKYLDVTLAPRISRLRADIKSSGSLSAMNSLGVLYARYGQLDRAEEVFKQVLAKKAYLPAILNLGHLYFLKEDWKTSLSFYLQASKMLPNNPRVLLALAKVNLELLNYAEMKKNYDKLKAVNPSIASQYAYLGVTEERGPRAIDKAAGQGP